MANVDLLQTQASQAGYFCMKTVITSLTLLHDHREQL